MSEKTLSLFENEVNETREAKRFSMFPIHFVWDPRPSHQGNILCMVVVMRMLAAFPIKLVDYILKVSQIIQSKNLGEKGVVTTCKYQGPFSNGYGQNLSTRTLVSVNVFEPLPDRWDVEFIEAVNDRRLANVQAFWGRHSDKERKEDFPELEGMPADEFLRRFRVPYRRGFNDDLRFERHPELEIPKTYEELKRLFPKPYVDAGEGIAVTVNR